MNYAVILAGGTGTRLGSDIPKQYIKVDGRMVIEYCLDTILSHSMINAIQIVATDEWEVKIRAVVDGSSKLIGFSKPGANRQLSIYNALMDLKDIAMPDDCIIIHDAARPLLKAELITECLEKMNERDCDGVMPVLPMKDTVYLCEDGHSVSSLINRNQVFAGQAPEFFRYGKYMSANEALFPDKIMQINGSTEPAVLAGMNIEMLPGDEGNFKITTSTDLERFEEILSRR